MTGWYFPKVNLVEKWPASDLFGYTTGKMKKVRTDDTSEANKTLNSWKWTRYSRFPADAGAAGGLGSQSITEAGH